MTNDKPVYILILPLVDINVYWPIIGQLYCMMSLFIRVYKLLHNDHGLHTTPIFASILCFLSTLYICIVRKIVDNIHP